LLDFKPKPDTSSAMGLRTRKFLGTLAIFLWMVVFSLAVMAVMGSFQRPPVILEIVIYAALGFGWILPLKPVFIWMGKAPRPE